MGRQGVNAGTAHTESCKARIAEMMRMDPVDKKRVAQAEERKQSASTVAASPHNDAKTKADGSEKSDCVLEDMSGKPDVAMGMRAGNADHPSVAEKDPGHEFSEEVRAKRPRLNYAIAESPLECCQAGQALYYHGVPLPLDSQECRNVVAPTTINWHLRFAYFCAAGCPR